MSPLAWKILMIFIDHAKQRNKNEAWYENYPGYIAAWDLGKMLGGDGLTINPVDTKIYPRNEQEAALKELIDHGLVEEMEELHCRYRLVVKASKQEQPEPIKPTDSTIANYWSQPPRVQGQLRKEVEPPAEPSRCIVKVEGKEET